MKPVDFYNCVNQQTLDLAKLYGISNSELERYYHLTDYQMPEIVRFKGVDQAFAQYAFHAQNGQRISQIIKFKDKVDFLSKKLADFKPKLFLKRFSFKGEKDRTKSVDAIIDSLRYDKEKNPEGLKWSVDKSKSPDVLISRYANALIDGAIYFSKFKSKKGIIDDFKKHFANKNTRRLIDYLRSLFRHGFSVALCCDFLKELDDCFDLGKPDVHLKHVMAVYLGRDRDYYTGYVGKKDFECLTDFLALVEKIKKHDKNLTAYKLDRQIWLCCTGNFFLHKSDDIKESFIKKISSSNS